MSRFLLLVTLGGALGSTFASAFLLGALACGLEPVANRATEGEPCTRTEKCVSGLVCTGGACRRMQDGGAQDAFVPFDAGEPLDAAMDAGRDAGDEDAGEADAGESDASLDGSAADGGDAAP